MGRLSGAFPKGICTKCFKSKKAADFYKGHRQCKSCLCAIACEWAKRNRVRKTLLNRAWKKKNKDKIRKSNRKYFEKNKAYYYAKHVEWYKKHPEVRRAKSARYYQKYRERNLKFLRDNPEYGRVIQRRRRAKIRGCKGNHTRFETMALLKKQKFRCANPKCCCDLKRVKHHLDHKQPLSLGGSNGIKNLQWLCAPCNLSKHAKPKKVWERLVT